MSFSVNKAHLVLYGDTTTFHPNLPAPQQVAVHPFCLNAWKHTLEKTGLVAEKHFSIVKTSEELCKVFLEGGELLDASKKHTLIIPGGHAVSLSYSLKSSAKFTAFLKEKIRHGSLNILGSCSGAIQLASFEECPYKSNFTKRPFELAEEKGRIVKINTLSGETQAFSSFWNAGVTFQVNPAYNPAVFLNPKSLATYPEAEHSIAGFSFEGPEKSVFIGLGFHPEIGPELDPETINNWTDPTPGITFEENEKRRHAFLSKAFERLSISRDRVLDLEQIEEDLLVCY